MPHFLRCFTIFLYLSKVTGFAEVVEPHAWEKLTPENICDLADIQVKLQELVPLTSKALVALETEDGAGSGVIISPDGLILSAAHVIGRTGVEMDVRLLDGSRAKAVSLGGSEISDAGMLQIQGEGPWPHAEIAEMKSSNVGDWCFGLGHPGGFDMERGMVVRIGRIIKKQDETMQTDSRLLGGDSGGPLFSFDGRVIAIHSRISKEPDQNFHVPIESFHANWDFFRNQDLLTFEEIEQGGFLGVACEESNQGLIIRSVLPDTPAESAGFLENDIILKIDTQAVRNREKLTILISTKKPEDEVMIEYQRDKSVATLKLKLGSRFE